MDSKSVLNSKTIYLNVALAIVAVAQHYFGVQLAPEEVQIVVAALANIAVRLITKEPVHILPPKE